MFDPWGDAVDIRQGPKEHGPTYLLQMRQTGRGREPAPHITRESERNSIVRNAPAGKSDLNVCLPRLRREVHRYGSRVVVQFQYHYRLERGVPAEAVAA